MMACLRAAVAMLGERGEAPRPPASSIDLFPFIIGAVITPINPCFLLRQSYTSAITVGHEQSTVVD